MKSAVVFMVVILLSSASLNGGTPPSTGLYFMLGNTVYLSGDTVNITDIGDQPTDRNDAGMTLVCVTSNVNTNCCRSSDNFPSEMAIGNLLNPSGQNVAAFNMAGSNSLFNFRCQHQMRLGSRGSPTGPLGDYRCVVPDMTGTLISISITLTATPTVISVMVSSTSSSGVAGVTSITLTCTAIILAAGTPMFTWSGPVPQGSMAGQGSGDTYTNTLTLGRVAQSYAGTYTCEVTLGDSTNRNSIYITVTVPLITISISQSGTPTALRSYTLTCAVTAPSSLQLSSQSYTWRRNNIVLNGENANTLTFNPLQYSENNAVYTCQYRASSVFLNNMVNIISSGHTISVTIASLTAAPASITTSPQTTSVVLSWEQSSMDYVNSYSFGYSGTATCGNAPSGVISRVPTSNGRLETYTITGLEAAITYEIAIIAINTANRLSATVTTTTLSSTPSGMVNNLRISEVDFTSITVTWEPVSCLLKNGDITSYKVRYFETSLTVPSPVTASTTSFTASTLFPGTSYTFEIAAVNSEGDGPYRQTIQLTMTPTDFGLLNGNLYSNNSIITITDIGQNNNALFCFMNISNCCRGSDGSVSPRDWYLPDNTVVPNVNTAPISRSRGPRSVILHRSNTNTPTGMYRCQIQNIYVYFGIYSDNTGLATLSSLAYNTTSGVVSCISTGGPATTVTWSRNGSSYQQSKIVVNTVTATYHNLLSITSSQISDYSGSFTCTVSNSRGSSSRSTGHFRSIALSGTKDVYVVGSSARIICFSNFTILSIRWTSLSSNVIYSSTMRGSQELLLSIDQITGSIDGSTFICELTNLFPNGAVKSNTLMATILTEERKSGPVFNLLIQSINDSAIFISWISPEMPNGVITNYLILIIDIKNNRDIRNTSTYDSSSLNFTESNLEPGLPYNVSIAAINSKGPGELASEVIFTKELVPSIAPKNVAAVRTSETSITLLWIKLTLSEARGFIWNYTIAYYSSASQQNPNIMYKTVEGGLSTATIDSLDAKSVYIVQISANTAAGGGPSSQAIVIQPLGTTFSSEVTQVIQPVQGNTGAVVAAVLVSVIAAVVIVALIFIIILLLFRRQRKSSASIVEIKHNSMNEIHEYENVNIHQLEVATESSDKTEEIDLKTCPAYERVVTTKTDEEELSNAVQGVYETIQ